MGSCKSIIGRFTGFAVLLLASGCIQRTAPIDIPNASPPPRTVVQAPQQPVFKAPPSVARAPVPRCRTASNTCAAEQ